MEIPALTRLCTGPTHPCGIKAQNQAQWRRTAIPEGASSSRGGLDVSYASSTLSALVAAAAFAMASSAAFAQNRTFSFAYDQPKSAATASGAEMFDKKLKELSKGTLSINQYPSAQLGTEAQTMQKVQTGDIDFVLLSTANASTAQPESGVFSIHFIFRDEKHAIKVLGDPKVIAAMKDLYAAKIKGAHMLGLGSQGLRHMYGKKPMQKVADLRASRCAFRRPSPKTPLSRPTARKSCIWRSARSTRHCRPVFRHGRERHQ